MTESEYHVEIEAWGRHGMGVCRINDRKWYLPYVIPGEIVSVRYQQNDLGDASVYLLGISKPAPTRCSDPCQFAHICPGCQIRQLTYPAQLEWLHRKCQHIMEMECGILPSRLDPVFPHPVLTGYRRRVTVKIIPNEYNIVMGMMSHEKDGHPIDLSHCPNHRMELNRILRQVHDILFDDHLMTVHFTETIRWICVELSEDSPHRITFVVNSIPMFLRDALSFCLVEQLPAFSLHVLQSAPPSEKTTGYYPVILQGETDILFSHAGLLFTASPGVWTPVSNGSSEQLSAVLEQVMAGESWDCIVEIGCGIGLQSVKLASRSRLLIGIDHDWAAVRNARENFDRHGVSNAMFLTGRAHHAIRKLLGRGIKADCLVLHGMRKPFDSDVLGLLTAFDPRITILIAPSIGILAREVRWMMSYGWTCSQIDLIDQIPHTVSVLGVATMRRNRRINGEQKKPCSLSNIG